MASGGKSVVFTAIAALGVFAGPGPGAAEAHEREAPRVGADLAVQSVTVTPKRSPQYFLIDDPGGIQPVFGVRVKNVGEAPTRADGRFRITLVLDDESPSRSSSRTSGFRGCVPAGHTRRSSKST